MVLGQIVLGEIERLRSLRIEDLRALPAISEKQIDLNGKPVELYVYRESSQNGRVTIIVKVFQRRFLYLSAAAEGFAITADGQFVDLDDDERWTLY